MGIFGYTHRATHFETGMKVTISNACGLKWAVQNTTPERFKRMVFLFRQVARSAKMNPNFQHIGRCGPLNYYYTAPAKVSVSPTESTESRFETIKSSLDEMRGRGAWVWIFDCDGMEMRHTLGPEAVRRMANLIATEHAEELQRIVFVRPNFWMQNVLTLMRSLFSGPLAAKILVLDGRSRLETMISLEEVGLSGEVLAWMMGCFFSSVRR